MKRPSSNRFLRQAATALLASVLSTALAHAVVAPVEPRAKPFSLTASVRVGHIPAPVQTRAKIPASAASTPTADTFQVPWQVGGPVAPMSARVDASLAQGQRHALLAQRQASGDFSARLASDHTFRRLTFARGAPGMAASKAANKISAAARGRDFFLQHRDLLQQAGDPSEFVLIEQFDDTLGQQHLVYEQRVNGLPVWGNEVRLHLTPENQPLLFQGRYDSQADWPAPTPRMDDGSATSYAEAHLGLRAERLAGELLYYVHEDEAAPTLAWRIELKAGLGVHFDYFVDADSGQILHRLNRVPHGSAVNASGLNLSGAETPFTSWMEDAVYFMIDPTFPINDVTGDYDPITNGINDRGDAAVYTADNSEGERLLHVTSPSRTSQWDAAAVSAMDNMRRVYDFYLNRFSRKSLDDNDMSLQSIVHYGENVANAFYSAKIMVYGDGDGTVFSSLAACDDVAAHEMTHGVIQYTANLIYENQSGALNESFADVFAVLFDDEDWTLGEDCTLASPGYTRSLSSPNSGLSRQPATFDDYQYLPNTEAGDYGGVHINSGIPNHAFYLTASNLGTTAAGKIYYRALTTYLTRSSDFLDAREALEQSAEDLYGANSAELRAVSNAWDTVGVTEATAGGSNSGNTGVDPIAGEDLLVFLSPTSEATADIYVQNFGSNWDGTSVGTLSGPINTVSVMPYYQPSVVTLFDGTFVIYVGTDLNLYATRLGDGVTDTINDQGVIRNAAVSPDGDKFAFLLDSFDNLIYVFSATTNEVAEYPLEVTNYQESTDGAASVVRYADSLAFDYSSSQIIFDARLCTPMPAEPCDADDENSGDNYWSIAVLDLNAEGRTNFPFPSQPSTVTLRHPKFAYNRNDVAVLDYAEIDGESGEVISAAVSYQFETQDLTQISTGVQGPTAYYTMPSFWGDDEHVTWRYFEGDQAAVSEVSAASNWAGSNSATLVNDGPLSGPIMHRTGVRSLSTLALSTRSLNFGEVSRGVSETRSISVSNQGNAALTITNIATSSDVWTHNGLNATLAAGASMTIDVTFTPNGSNSRYEGSLIIESDAPNGTDIVALSGNEGSASASGGGGGAFGLLLLPLLLLQRAARVH